MKKLEKAWSKYYSSLKVFRDDIEEIAGIITSGLEQKKDSKGLHNKIEIRADGFVLDNLSELGEFKDNYLRELELSTEEYPPLRLSLTPKSADLRVCDSDDTTLMGIAMRIDAVLQKRRGFLGRFNTIAGFIIFSVLFWGLIPLLPLLLASNHLIFFVISVLIIIFSAVCYWRLYYHVSTICLRYSHDESNFFVRNKDAILLIIITAVVTALFSVLSTLFVQRIKAKSQSPPTTSQTVPKEANEVSQKQ